MPIQQLLFFSAVTENEDVTGTPSVPPQWDADLSVVDVHAILKMRRM